MNLYAIIDRISNEKDANLARNAVAEAKKNLLQGLIDLELLLEIEEDDFVAIGKQRAYREMRMLIQS